MLFIFVTLDVSKLSGWLNVTAPCRVETSKGGHAMWEEVRPGRREGIGGSDDASGMHGEERTLNMRCMVVTLEVSKLSGWLNADAMENMPSMVVTLDVSKLSGWLNADAPKNM